MEQTDVDGCSALFCVSVRLADQKWCQSMCMYFIFCALQCSQVHLTCSSGAQGEQFQVVLFQFMASFNEACLQYDV